jgi:hypothetical protein
MMNDNIDQVLASTCSGIIVLLFLIIIMIVVTEILSLANSCSMGDGTRACTAGIAKRNIIRYHVLGGRRKVKHFKTELIMR